MTPAKEAGGSALALARRGFFVLPCHYPAEGSCSCGNPACGSPAKHPLARLVPHGLKDASIDLDLVHEWWEAEPCANVGIACGPSRLVVIDVDPRHDGDTSLVQLEHDLGSPLATAHVKTGGGGDHFLFESNGTPIKSGRLAGYPGIDVKAHGGYIIGAGSLHMSGQRYTWDASSVPTPTPPRLLALLTREAKPAPPARPTSDPGQPAGGQPGTDFIVRGAWDGPGMLTAHGWTVDHTVGEETFWTREGKTGGVSASTNYQNSGLFYCFSTSTAFEPERGYSKFAVFAILNHHADFAAAAAELAAQGYGVQAGETPSISGETPRVDSDSEPSNVPIRSRWTTDVALIHRQAPHDLIDGILADKGAAMVYGAPGTCKSFFSLAVGASISTGAALFGRYGVLRQGPVIYIVGEGAAHFGQRSLAWKMHHQVDVNQVALHIFDGALNLMDLGMINAFIAEARRLQPTLVILDTLARCAIGADENSVKDVSKALAAIDRIRTDLDCGVLVVHHANKGGNEERGSSALRGAFDQMMSLDRSDDLLTLRPDKAKDTAITVPIGLRLMPVPGTPSCVLVLSDEAPAGDVTPNQLQALRVLRDLGEGGLQAGAWERMSKLKESTFYRVRVQLLKRAAVADVRHCYSITSIGRRLLSEAGEL